MRELFQQEAPEKPRRSRGNMYKGITPDYYGFRDEDDGVLLPKEAEAEKRAIDEAQAEHRAKRQRQLEAGEAVAADDDGDGDFAHDGDVPTQEETTKTSGGEESAARRDDRRLGRARVFHLLTSEAAVVPGG